MAWYRPPVSKCPIVKKTQGVVLMEDWVIAELAGASWEEFEWTALFLGETDERSLIVKVDNILVPQTQVRGRGHIKIPDDWKVPDWAAPLVVGVVHLHPGLHYNNRVNFSSIDTGAGGLNERWPMSMVIGRTNSQTNLEAFALGFDYEIYGRCLLPCGAPGTIQYFLHPSVDGEAEKDWPFKQKVVEPTIITPGMDIVPEPNVVLEHPDLGDCSRYVDGEGTTRYERQRLGTCGLVETVKWLQPLVFGATGEGILDHLPVPDTFTTTYNVSQGTQHQSHHHQHGKGHKKGNGRDKSPVNPANGKLLGGWSTVGGDDYLDYRDDYDDYGYHKGQY